MTKFIIDGQKAKFIKILGYDKLDNKMLLIEIQEHEIPIIVHNNGCSIPADWQGYLPQTPNEISEIEWVNVSFNILVP